MLSGVSWVSQVEKLSRADDFAPLRSPVLSEILIPPLKIEIEIFKVRISCYLFAFFRYSQSKLYYVLLFESWRFSRWELAIFQFFVSTAGEKTLVIITGNDVKVGMTNNCIKWFIWPLGQISVYELNLVLKHCSELFGNRQTHLQACLLQRGWIIAKTLRDRPYRGRRGSTTNYGIK